MNNLLTASRMSALLQCPRKHFWRYEIGLRTTSDALALRLGSAWHRAMEARWAKLDYDAALAAAVPDGTKLDELAVATVSGLLAGYYAYWEGKETVKHIHSEVEFRQPLSGSRTFTVAGKIDGLAVLHDGRLALLEHKTTSDAIEPDSDYWLRLRFNSQVYQYVLAARSLGWDVATVIYDVTRKPAIRQKKDETVEEFAKRLAEDTQARPDFYFARREVPILESDLQEFETQRLVLSRHILSCRVAEKKLARRESAWPRNVGTMTCRSCEFDGFCLQNVQVNPEQPPAGFTIGFNTELSPEASS